MCSFNLFDIHVSVKYVDELNGCCDLSQSVSGRTLYKQNTRNVSKLSDILLVPAGKLMLSIWPLFKGNGKSLLIPIVFKTGWGYGNTERPQLAQIGPPSLSSPYLQQQTVFKYTFDCASMKSKWKKFDTPWWFSCNSTRWN